MADTKISALPASITPLAGTEVLPIVQGGATVKVSVADLTAGRDASVKKLTATDNLVVGTAGKGIDFSANTHAAGMTSELLTWYEEGTWTPAGTNITLAAAEGRYTRIGRQVTCWFYFTFPSTADGSNAVITGLPFAVKNDGNAVRGGAAFGVRSDSGLANLTLVSNDNTSELQFRVTSGGSGTDATRPSNAQLSTFLFIGSVTYVA
jgi:hypothetical protein